MKIDTKRLFHEIHNNPDASFHIPYLGGAVVRVKIQGYDAGGELNGVRFSYFTKVLQFSVSSSLFEYDRIWEGEEKEAGDEITEKELRKGLADAFDTMRKEISNGDNWRDVRVHRESQALSALLPSAGKSKSKSL